MLRNELPKIVTPQLPGPKSAALIARREKTIPSAIKCIYPVTIARGEGAMIEDLDGNYFLDWIGGVGVLNIGFSHPEVVQAVKDQADKYFHAMFNMMTQEGYVALSEKISAIAPVRGEKKRTFFANSGAESVENAIKIAKAFTKRPNIIAFTSGFHGRTNLTMALSAKKGLARGMGPFPNGVARAEYPYMYHAPEGLTYEEKIDWFIDDLKRRFEDSTLPESTAAIIIEPILGDGGFAGAPIEWVKKVRKICDDYGIMFIADEVQSGWCRSGKWFVSNYWQEAGAAPDIICTAKSIAGGIPISAIVAREEIIESVPVGVIGGTYCGNPLACASALKIIEIMERDKLGERALEIGKKVLGRYEQWKEKYECVGDARGLGSMIGIEFVKTKAGKEPASQLVSDIVQECAKNGLLVESAGKHGSVIRFLAPLVMTDAQTEAGLKIFEAAIAKCSK